MRQLTISKQITNRETQSLDKYLTEIGKLDMVTPEEEANLARRIREGDAIALEKLAKANLRFVVSVAKQYQNFGPTLNDLINEGNVGLIKAAQRFDETRGFKFISYAVWWIRQAIMESLAQHTRIVHLPLNRVASVNKVAKTFSRLEQEFQREPSAQEIAEAAGMTAHDVIQTQSHSRLHVSVDAPLQAGEDNNLHELLTDADQETPDVKLMADSLKTEIQRALATLSTREAEVMVCYFGLDGNAPLTLGEIGARFALTTERIRQIKSKATHRLKNHSRNKILRGYL